MDRLIDEGAIALSLATMKEMVEAQEKALLELGRRIVPTLTAEDMLQPNDYPELENHPVFRYEEGILAGLLSAQMALQALERDLGVRTTN